jgi:transcriptional regulator with XRE-family HTH domain
MTTYRFLLLSATKSGTEAAMTDAQQLVDTLKKLLKAQNLTYAEVAGRVGLSEASVKRLFSARTFTLKRLETFCRLLDIDFFELARLARSSADEVREMTVKQETALANDAKLLGVFYLLLSDWKAADIVARYELSRAARAFAAAARTKPSTARGTQSGTGCRRARTSPR